MTPRVEVLCPGRIRRNGKVVLEAHSTVSLIACADHRIIVDTSSRENRAILVEALRDVRLDAKDVDILVNTHGHHDHTENNDLFPAARKVLGPLGRMNEEGAHLAEGVWLVPTPGHTEDSISVFVDAELRYAIVGDAIPTQDNFLRWVPPGLNYDERVALDSMERIVHFAQVIIPGHGPAFPVDR